ncbi:MAG: hypothetical protein DWQ07_18990 [Chloroflexi bacterium]|nr:MAG: hypothetical protein DWQ07_18990 [Chloroflexota bacterium]MBL1195019.1 hypothetical protein [Chloroflexota bacterium]NOH12308.1 hypothetical protein [Chloroflexota bacterium]
MTTIKADKKGKSKCAGENILEMAELAEGIIEDAVQLANTRQNISLEDEKIDTLLDRREYLGTFRYGLAKGITEALVENDAGVVAVYSFEPNANPDAETEDYLSLDGNVDMIALVEKRSAGLVAFTDSLDRALTERINEFSTPVYAKCSSLLDVKFVTQEDVDEGRGFAVLLQSLFSPPMRIWQRE